MNILLITEQRGGQWNKVSFETLAAAQQIAAETSGKLAAVVIGKGVASLASELAAKQLSEVLLVEHDLLKDYTPDGFSLALKQVIEQVKPDLVLLPHTYQVRDFAPKLAEITDDVLYADVWERPQLSRRDRSLVTVAALIAMNLVAVSAQGTAAQLKDTIRFDRTVGALNTAPALADFALVPEGHVRTVLDFTRGVADNPAAAIAEVTRAHIYNVVAPPGVSRCRRPSAISTTTTSTPSATTRSMSECAEASS